MRKLIILAAVAAVLATAAPGALAQEPLDLKIEDIDATAHPGIAITVILPQDMVGLDIVEGGFAVLENEAARDVTVEPLSAADLEVVLVVDLSGSMRGDPLAAAKAAVTDFTGRLPDGVQVALVSFATEATVVTDFTSDIGSVVDAVAALEAGGETALYDGLVAAADLFADRDIARRSLVVLTDGGDTVSASTLEDANTALAGAGAGFYAVALQSPESDNAALVSLGAATAGVVVAADDPTALAGIFDEIATELINRYRITFESGETGPTDVAISITAEGTVASATRTVAYPSPPPVTAVVPPPPPPPKPAPTTTTTTTTIAPHPREPITVTPGPLAQGWALAAGTGAIFVGLTGLFLAVQAARRDGQLAGTRKRRRKDRNSDGAIAGLTSRATLFADRELEKRRIGSKLGTALEQAGIMLRPGEYVLLALATSLLVTALGSLFVRLTWAAALGLATAGFFRLHLRMRARRRQLAFAAQLSDTLQLIGGGLRAGYGLLQAIDSVANEALSPTSEELHRLVIETNLGRDLIDSLRAMAARVQSEDFGWVVDAIQVHREVGGDLAEILDSVATTIRDRAQIRRRIRALSAEGRLSAVILLSLPFGVGTAIAVTNPEYLGELTGSVAGKAMIAAGIFLMFVGAAWMRRIVSLKF